MRYDHLYVAGAGYWLPPRVSTLQAVRAGELSAERREQIEFLAVAVAPDTMAPPQMAVEAARMALERAGTEVGTLAVLLHSSGWFQGLDMWPTASYIADRAGVRFTPAFDLQQRCNGGMGSLELAARFLAGSDGQAALLTTADRVRPPRIDRWNSVDVCIYGDGGTAVVLSSAGGFAAVHAIYTAADNSLELLARGTEPFAPLPPDPMEVLYLDGRARTVASARLRDAGERIVSVFRAARDGVLAEAGVNISDIAKVVTPATRRGRGHLETHHLLGIPEQRTTWHFGRRSGHLTSGDQFAGLAHLVEAREVSAGDLVLLYGGGSGFTVTAAVLEILELPPWTAGVHQEPCTSAAAG